MLRLIAFVNAGVLWIIGLILQFGALGFRHSWGALGVFIFALILTIGAVVWRKPAAPVAAREYDEEDFDDDDYDHVDCDDGMQPDGDQSGDSDAVQYPRISAATLYRRRISRNPQ